MKTTGVSKTYNIFISHTKADQKIANEIKILINDSFNGNVKAWLASEEIKSGDKWKTEIKENLEKCQAIITVVTDNSKMKPWLFVEWSAFWVADRAIHIFVTEGLTESDLIDPMRDIQYAVMTNEDAVKGFMSRVAKAAGIRPTPYDLVEDFLVRLKSILQQMEKDAFDNSYQKFANIEIALPKDDAEKEKIAEYFIEKG